MLSQISSGLLLTGSFLFSFACVAADGPGKKILFFSKSSGFEHSAIKVADGEPSPAQKVLTDLGAKHGLEFTFTKDGTVFSPENLAKYDAFMFYTTGDLTTRGTDGNPPMSKEGKAAFLQAIHDGKGFVGVHSATDTFHSPAYAKSRYLPDGDQADPYIKMIGGEFILHGSQQTAKMIVVDKNFPGMSQVPPDFRLHEEWYSLKNFAPDLHVLLIQDTSDMIKTGNNHCYDRAPYPATWAHHYGKGRVFYSSMGHREDVWTNPVFQEVLLGGLNWAVGNVKADVTPNIDSVTPQANTLPSPR